jgi:hypothetical protein
MSGSTKSEDAANVQPSQSWSTQRKVLVSIAIGLHLFAVFAGPCASPPPASYLWNVIAGRVDGQDGILTPYLRAAYLNHGYRFFAPNPGPSHLVRFEIDLDSGTMIEGQFPDVDEHYPRLLYHRMFMISETAFSLADSVREMPAPNSLSDAERAEFDKQLATTDALAKSIARQLLAQHQGQRVRLYIRTHEIPFPNDVAAGQSLDDPALFHEFAWRSYSKEQL